MKFTNLSKLLIKFIGGGLVNFPTRYLKEVEVEAEGGESDGEGSGNNDELLLKTKQIIADYASAHLGNGTQEYVADNVELPDFYIYFDRDNKILYDCNLEISYIDPRLIPVYLNSRNIGEDSIIIADDGKYSSANIPATPLSLFISSLPEGTVNKISLNADDYIIFEKLIII